MNATHHPARKTPRRLTRVAVNALAAGTAALALFGCSTPGGSSESPTGPVDLRMVMWSANQAHHDLFETIGAAYVAENPDKVASVSFEPLTGTAYASALTTQIAGGDAPDLAWIAESYAPQFVTSGVFADLTPAFEATESFELDDVLPGALDLWTHEGKHFGYPFSNSPFGVYANLDLLEAAGQPNPRDLIASGQWTWDALAAAGAATAESQGVAGFVPSADPYRQWNDALGAMWLSWGAQPWGEDGNSCAMDSPEMVDFFEWFHGHIFTTGAIPGPGEEFDFASGQAAFKAGQLSGSTTLGDAFNWDFLPFPEGPAGAVPVVGQGGIAVIARGDHPEIAAEFLAYFVNRENSELLAQFFPPPRASLMNVKTLSAAAPALSDEQIQTTVIDQTMTAVTKPGNAAMSEVSDRIRAAFDGIWVPNADPGATLSALCEEIDPILAGE